MPLVMTWNGGCDDDDGDTDADGDADDAQEEENSFLVHEAPRTKVKHHGDRVTGCRIRHTRATSPIHRSSSKRTPTRIGYLILFTGNDIHHQRHLQ